MNPIDEMGRVFTAPERLIEARDRETLARMSLEAAEALQ